MQKNKEQRTKQEPVKRTGGDVGKQDNWIERIRARSSYLLFQQLYNFLVSRPTTVEILRKFYDVLDAKGGFGSIRNAEYAKQSLDWVLKDNGM